MLENEIYSDSIMPFLKKELNRKVDIHGKVLLKGGIFCHNLEIEGEDIFIQKSVYSEESILIKGNHNGIIWFNSPVSAGQAILVDEKCHTRVRFAKSIQSKSINLFNSIVYGNVIAENVILKNSIVLGGIFCSQKLETENSIVGTYKCRDIKQNGNMGLLYPLALSDNKPEKNDNLFIVIPGTSSAEDAKNIYHITDDDFYTFSKTSGEKHLYSNTLRIFDMKLYYSKMHENLIKLYDSFTRKLENLDELKVPYADFDNTYFSIIENGFTSTGKALCSDFMDVTDDKLNEYFSGRQVAENAAEGADSRTASSSGWNQSDKSTASSDTSPEDNSGILSESFKIKMICKECGREYGEEFRFCEDCGSQLAKKEDPISNPANADLAQIINSVIRCHSCGAELPGMDYAFCPECGQALERVKS
jgi:hypothetical protein